MNIGRYKEIYEERYKKYIELNLPTKFSIDRVLGIFEVQYKAQVKNLYEGVYRDEKENLIKHYLISDESILDNLFDDEEKRIIQERIESYIAFEKENPNERYNESELFYKKRNTGKLISVLLYSTDGKYVSGLSSKKHKSKKLKALFEVLKGIEKENFSLDNIKLLEYLDNLVKSGYIECTSTIDISRIRYEQLYEQYQKQNIPKRFKLPEVYQFLEERFKAYQIDTYLHRPKDAEYDFEIETVARTYLIDDQAFLDSLRTGKERTELKEYREYKNRKYERERDIVYCESSLFERKFGLGEQVRFDLLSDDGVYLSGVTISGRRVEKMDACVPVFYGIREETRDINNRVFLEYLEDLVSGGFLEDPLNQNV